MIQSLEKSYKDLPNSLLLIENINGNKKVIGHSRLSRVLEDPSGCWIGSVIIGDEKRNKGYGKYLMQKSEEYAKELHFSTVYLNTQDKQGFYEHLGYSYGKEVSCINFRMDDLLKNNFLNLQNKQKDHLRVSNVKQSENDFSKELANINISSPVPENGPPPPPPPPPPSPSDKNKKLTSTFNNLGQYWMEKRL
ncbi:N-alpha-acetyltransferase 80-like isoform X3 [Stegodyphus dumicola]|uniref:N-alpha-acetyltransferase 80-like isoform X2 n=1 Tax=Stegodyphus dumicola TaxID=202533 RepID=UPI0015ACCC44|nr:N-alpha-acetyltransferase 80-like isoform X2 [Stegodyphus dumicola]XP_035216552.1 N-alpha-acetyltransferase 80-like isoform X3 [Stegodyphus dumicola]